MKPITKRIIALVLILATVLSFAGCTVSFPESNYRAYMKDPVGYLEKELGEDHPLIGILASPLGQEFFTAMFKKSEADKKKEQEQAQKAPVTQPEQTPEMPYYRTHNMDKLFNDQDWEYISRNQSTFIKITGYISHGFVGAKKKYKEAFRAYLKEFIVDNADRYNAEDLPFEEKKAILLTFLKDTKDELDTAMKVRGLADAFKKMNEYDDLIKNLEKATEFSKDFDADFADLLKDTTDFVKKHDIELKVKISMPEGKHIKALGDIAKSAGKIAEGVELVLDVAECAKSVNDVLTIRDKVALFFEIDEIFTTIIQNTTDYYMREAAREVLSEIHGGEITDVGELVVAKGVHVIVDINPIVAALSSLMDFVWVNFTPLKDLDEAYTADAILHIKMACCKRLQDYTVRKEGDKVYYDERYELEVNTYLLHCLQTQLVWTYAISGGESFNKDVIFYEEASGIRLPIAANDYIANGKRF